MHPCPSPILVVEQHPDVRTVIHAALEHEGYLSVPAPSTQKALRALEWMERPGLILLDELLADGELEHFILYVRTHQALRRVPIVLLSVGGPASRVLGVQAILRKPFQLDALIDVVEAQCLH
ncbi:response regulator [Melittangium boletus]|uniref:response regulator n=1 Tax=Melittangium boletus TaxID=83453 RepID=UPI003DA4C9AB